MNTKAFLGFVGVIVFSVIWTGCFEEGAKESKQLFAYTTLEEPLAQRLFKAYRKETGVSVQFVRLSTGEAAARIEAESKNPQASIWVGGVGLGHIQIQHKGLSVPYRPKNAELISKQFRDPNGYWTGLYVGALCLVSNKKELEKRGLEAPQSWEDLLKPEYQGHVQVANPGTSGTAYNILTTQIGLKGEEKTFEYLKKLHQNISQYTRSGSAPVKNVVIGEAVVGIGYSHDAVRLLNEQKAPLEIHFPKEGTGFEIASISLIKGGKQPELSKELYEWLYTKTASQIIADYYIVPLLTTGVELKKGAVAPHLINLVPTDLEWDGKNKKRLVEIWNDRVNS